MSNVYEKNLTINFWFKRQDGKAISTEYEEPLHEAAMARIREMTEGGYTSGQLAENLCLPDEDTNDDGVEFTGWWSITETQPAQDDEDAAAPTRS